MAGQDVERADLASLVIRCNVNDGHTLGGLGAALAKPMSAQETNLWLTGHGYQTATRGWTGKIKYEATEEGEPFSEMCDVPLDTGRSQRQLVWRMSIIAVIDAGTIGGRVMKLGEITIKGRAVSMFAPPHDEPDFPWVDVEQLARAFLPPSAAKRMVSHSQRFGGDVCTVATTGTGTASRRSCVTLWRRVYAVRSTGGTATWATQKAGRRTPNTASPQDDLWPTKAR